MIVLERKHDAWLARWSGANAWFVRPVDPFELADRLVELIEGSINSTLARTILTAVTTTVALTSLYLFGGYFGYWVVSSTGYWFLGLFLTFIAVGLVGIVLVLLSAGILALRRWPWLYAVSIWPGTIAHELHER